MQRARGIDGIDAELDSRRPALRERGQTGVAPIVSERVRTDEAEQCLPLHPVLDRLVRGQASREELVLAHGAP